MEPNKSHESTGAYSVDPIVSQALLFYFQVVNNVFISQFVAIFGSVANVINMVVFSRIGFQDTINISLFGLAISDFGSCSMMIGASLSLNPWFNQIKLPFYPRQVLYLTCGWPRVIFTKITILITTFITFERCLCVVMPLKVKSIITHTRVYIVLVMSYGLVIASYVPLYFVNRLGWKFDPRYNESMLGLIFTVNREEIESVLFTVHSLVFSNVTFILIVIFTVTLTVELQKKAKWRKNVTKSDQVSSKEKKVVKMVITISLFFIACFTPHSVFLICLSIEPEFSITGRQSNLYISVVSFMVMFETINSATNIFIYYYNSSVYRAMFRSIFKLEKKEVSGSK